MTRALCRALWILLLLPALGQDGADVDIAPPKQEGLSAEAVTRRLEELATATDLEEAQRAELTQVYEQVLQNLEAAKVAHGRAEAYRSALTSAPAETELLAPKIQALRDKDPGPPTWPEGDTSELAQQRHAQALADAQVLRGERADLARRRSEESARPAAIPSLITAARAAADTLEAELQTPAPPPDGPELARARRALSVARLQARQAEVDSLEQELLSNTVRVELLERREEHAALRLADTERRAGLLEQRVSELRTAEAERSRREADRLRLEAIGKHELVRKVTEEIGEIAEDNTKLLGLIDGARAARTKVETRLERTTQDLEETKRSLELQISRSLGTVLLEQRRQLPSAREFRKAASERSRHASAERFALFQAEREMRALENLEARIDQRLAPYASSLSPQDRDDLKGQLRTLLATKLEQLRLLETTRQTYLTVVGQLEASEGELIARAKELGDILDERLLWIPNAPRVNLKTFGRLSGELQSLIAAPLWRAVVDTALADLVAWPGGYALSAIVLLLLVLLRRRATALLATIALRVGRVREDGLRLSLQALLLQVALAVPLPACVALLGWRWMKSAEAPEMVKAVGAGLVTSATIGFSMHFLRSLCQPNGICSGHFRWKERSQRLVRRHLGWYMLIALPVSYLVALCEAQSDPLLRYGTGRFAFVVLMVAAAVLAWRLLHPQQGILPVGGSKGSPTFLTRSRPLWMPLGVLIPLLLAALAVAGYYYAAVQLELRLNQTLLSILSAVILHALLLRWLSISQRRLSWQLAQEKRAALERSREGAAPDAKEMPTESGPDLDVVVIKQQTHDLLRMTMGFVLALSLWFVWVGVLPALGVLDEVPLWQRTVTVDGAPAQVPVTLANLALSLLLFGVTFAAARNMPGLLEMAVLQRLKFEPGVRYAIRTLVLYAIVTTGVVLAFNAMGIGWSSVQWLVAALTVGLGFGLQEIFANFVSGLIILLERPVRVGDTVTVAGTTGMVSRIRMRATTITDWSRRELIVPNKAFITSELVNWSLSDPIMRLEFVVGIAYGSDTKLAHKVMLEACQAHGRVLEQPEPTVFFIGFGDNSLNFEVRVFVNEATNTARTRIVHDLHMTIDEACRREDISIAFPQRDLHFKTSEAVLRVSVERPEG